MKTLNQIWSENFDLLPADAYAGSDCGNQLGGNPTDNAKSPLDTLADKINQALNDPAMSDAAKEAKIQDILDDFFNGPPKGNGPIGNGPDPHIKLPPPGGVRPETPSNDPNDGPIPPGPGVPDVQPWVPDGGGVKATVNIGNDGSLGLELEGIKPDAAAAIKAGLSAAMAAKNAACANNKTNSNGNPTTPPATTPTPTPTTPLVTPPVTPPTSVVPFRPVEPPTTRPPGGVISGRPVKR